MTGTGMTNESYASTGATALSSSGLEAFWHIFGLVLIFMMQIGFTILEVGSVNIKNTKNILTKNVVNICVSLLAWWTIGYGFAYGNTSNGMLGTSRFFMGCEEYPDRFARADISLDPPAREFISDEDSLAFVVHQWGFASTAATIVSGAVAERIKVEAFATCTFFMVGIIYPIIAHAVWHADGWASISSSEYGAIDFAGSGAVHMTGGLVALIGAYVVGPRSGRFSEEGEPMYMVKQSTTLQTLGTLLLWFGWIGFNGCSVRLIHDGFSGIIAGRVVLNTLLAGAAGGLATLATAYKNGLGIDLAHINNGILSGLVSVTAGCATFHPWQAVIVASVAGPLYLGTSILLVKLRVDDVLDATAVHFSCGLWGVLSTGLFSTLQSVRFVYQIESCGAFYSCDGGRQLANQLLYIFAILLWVGVTASTLFYTMKAANFLRESFDDEEVGIDIARHNGEAYQIQPIMSFPVDFDSTDHALEVPPFAGDVAVIDATSLALSSGGSAGTAGSDCFVGDTGTSQAVQAPVPAAADSDI